MERYDERTKCPKCGCIHLTSEWDKDSYTIQRKCTNCSYSFTQLPLDYVPEPVKEVPK